MTGRRERTERSELQQAAVVGLWLLVVLNVADVVLTRLVLGRGGVEMNPLADLLLASNTTLAVKLAIVLALAVEVRRHPPRAPVVCLIWLVAGIYLVVVILNASVLAAGA